MLQGGSDVAAPGQAALASQGARGLARFCSAPHFSFGVLTAATTSLFSVSPVGPLSTGVALCVQLYTPEPRQARGLVCVCSVSE